MDGSSVDVWVGMERDIGVIMGAKMRVEVEVKVRPNKAKKFRQLILRILPYDYRLNGKECKLGRCENLSLSLEELRVET
jgi:hypothetical protein